MYCKICHGQLSEGTSTNSFAYDYCSYCTEKYIEPMIVYVYPPKEQQIENFDYLIKKLSKDIIERKEQNKEDGESIKDFKRMKKKHWNQE